MKLTVELEQSDLPEVAICFDAQGLEFLISKLLYLKTHIDHLHLMSGSWGGNELGEEPVGAPHYKAIHSLRLVRLNDQKPLDAT